MQCFLSHSGFYQKFHLLRNVYQLNALKTKVPIKTMSSWCNSKSKHQHSKTEAQRTVTVPKLWAKPAQVHHPFGYFGGSPQNYSSTYYDEMHKAWLADPKSVHHSWNHFFGGSPGSSSIMPATEKQGSSMPSASSGNVDVLEKHLAVSSMIRAIQARGHFFANLDPLGITSAIVTRKNDSFKNDGGGITEFTSKKLDESDMDRPFKLPQTTFIGGSEKTLTLREILSRLENVYTSTIGAEYFHINKIEQHNWIKQRLELPNSKEAITTDVRKLALARLLRSAAFEMFLAKKWASEKRFGLEGCEVLIPAMKRVIDCSTLHGVESVVIGMPHRGRLNVLANVCRKPLVHLFTQFAGLESADEGSGDVKYHLGTCIDLVNSHTQKPVRLAVVANPSHLEAVDPIVQGKVCAEQFYRGDKTGEKVMSILLHGDAAFAGQGVVFETIHLSALPQYTTHGTIHIVVNNQVGFTTDPRFSRSSPYCTDVGRVVQSPIFHVNADDPDAVLHVCTIAADWRNEFHSDVIIDLVCYRRNGHNEIDEPMFTQPLMYKTIKKIKPIIEVYSQQLIKEGVVTAEEFAAMKIKYDEVLEKALSDSKEVTIMKYRDWLDSPWKGFFPKPGETPSQKPTGIDEEVLQHIGEKFSSPPPDDFKIHKGIERILKGRKELVSNRMVDWALGEAMAFGSLLKEGVHVRLSGQDVERGTFSHRHHVLHHQTVDKAKYNLLSHLYPDQAVYSLCNSSLSEFGVLGFELGYSMTDPNALVMWEAQFGDFNNTAQCIIDQFLCSGQSKWIRQSGLVLLLPHGMEGMGPEHSSARIERFLQMSDDDPCVIPELNDKTDFEQLYATNWIVANCSNPGNYFHIIRRQIALPFRKPLILLTPKSLLRHPEARSSFDDLKTGSEFQPVIGEANSGSFKKLIFCYGRAYYDLKKVREERGKDKEVALARIEQLTPFPYRAIQAEFQKHSVTEVLWAQEEHKNNGPWTYVQPRLSNLLKSKIKYAGRPTNASPATGSKHTHYKEFDNMMDTAFA